MSEQKPVYDVGNVLPATLEAFSNRSCSLPFSDPNYCPPTPEEVKQLIALAGWSQNGTAKLAGVAWNKAKGSSTVRRWKAPADKPDSKNIPYAAWRLLLLYAGVIKFEDEIISLDHNFES
jgi:hypothetical protein